MSKDVRIKDFIVWDPFRIVRGKEGQFDKDELCFTGVLEFCNLFLSDNLYFCVNENLTDEEVLGLV